MRRSALEGMLDDDHATLSVAPCASPTGYSRFPVVGESTDDILGESTDDILGVVHVKYAFAIALGDRVAVTARMFPEQARELAVRSEDREGRNLGCTLTSRNHGRHRTKE